MAEIIHKVIGAGDEATNPIIVNLDCETSAGTISWVGREMLSGNCGCNKYYDNRYYTEISGETGYVTWEGVDVYYKGKLDCPSEEDETCSEYFCSDLSAYAVPSHVKEGFSGTIEIHYDYFLTRVNEHEKICSREKITGVNIIKYPEDLTDIANNSYTFIVCDDCPCSGSQKTIFFTTYKDDGTCTEKTTIELSVTTSTNEVSWKEETISVIYSFVKTKTNEDCSTKKTSGSVSEKWKIPKCAPKELDEKYCCKDHDITSSTTVGNVITNLGLTLGGNEVIIYDGEQVDTEKVITYSVTQKAKTTDECQSTCENKTTYCVDSGSVIVQLYIEATGKWKDVKTNSGDTNPEHVEVPEEGGKIKLTFSGTVTQTLSDCSKYTNDFSREIEIVVPDCHKKETSAPYVYYFADNKITYNYYQPCNGCYRIEPTSGRDCKMPKFTATPL